MRPRNTAQNKRLYALLNVCGLDKDDKRDLVIQYSNGRVESSAGLNFYECQSLIDYLQAVADVLNNNKENEAFKKADKQRKKVLSICHDLGWETPGGKIDWSRLNAWLLKYGYLHKELNKYTLAELPALVTQFEQLQKHKYAAGKNQN